MPLPSHRIRTLTPGGDDVWRIFDEARRQMAAGVPILDLTIGEHDIGTSEDILTEMHRAARAGATGYASVPGIPELRRAVAERLTAQHGRPYGVENVLITPGGQAALFAAHMAACDPGDRALMIDPYYATYPGTIRGAGAEPVVVPADRARGFQPDLDAISAAAPGARSLLINTPNNPTGAVYDAASLDGIGEIAQAEDLWVISDEVYDTQVWSGRHVAAASRPGLMDRVLTVGSLSKSHAMTGSRLGWLAGPPEIIGHAITLAIHTTYGVPGYIQRAGLYALRQGVEVERAIAAPFLRRRAAAMAQIAGQSLIRAIPPQGAMYVMLDVRATGLSGIAFAEGLLAEEQVAVMPGESFGAAAAGHLRVALTLPDDAFQEAFARLMRYAARVGSPAVA